MKKKKCFCQTFCVISIHVNWAPLIKNWGEKLIGPLKLLSKPTNDSNKPSNWQHLLFIKPGDFLRSLKHCASSRQYWSFISCLGLGQLVSVNQTLAKRFAHVTLWTSLSAHNTTTYGQSEKSLNQKTTSQTAERVN